MDFFTIENKFFYFPHVTNHGIFLLIYKDTEKDTTVNTNDKKLTELKEKVNIAKAAYSTAMEKLQEHDLMFINQSFNEVRKEYVDKAEMEVLLNKELPVDQQESNDNIISKNREEGAKVEIELMNAKNLYAIDKRNVLLKETNFIRSQNDLYKYEKILEKKKKNDSEKIIADEKLKKAEHVTSNSKIYEASIVNLTDEMKEFNNDEELKEIVLGLLVATHPTAIDQGSLMKFDKEEMKVYFGIREGRVEEVKQRLEDYGVFKLERVKNIFETDDRVPIYINNVPTSNYKMFPDYFTINNIAKSIGALFDNDEEVIRNIRNAIKEVKFQANKDNELLGNIYLGWSMQSLSMYFPNYLSKFNHLDLAYQISGKYIVLRSIKGSFRLNVYEKALKDLGHDLKTAYFCSNFKLQNEWSICKYVKIISMEMNNLLNNV
jgi:hypothetical protein